MRNYIYTCLLTLLGIQVGNTQTASYWKTITESSVKGDGVRQIIPQKYQCFRAEQEELRNLLYAAPLESEVKINNSTQVLTIPAPDGSFQRFQIIESPIMAPELGASFPDIRTYSVKGIDDVYANGKVDINEFGFHAMILSPNGSYFVDPYRIGNTQDYISYYTNDFQKDPASIIPEANFLDEDLQNIESTKNETPLTAPQQRPAAACAGNQLRIYRLAVACTGEYAVQVTGQPSPTKQQTLAKVVTTVNRVDGVYEKEVGIRLVLIPNDTLILFTVAATDPFTGTANASGPVLIGLSQSVITSNIGTSNFDIGHTFSTGGGGLANLGCVCVNSSKARGITGSANPVGDPYDIDYVAHEMGHQFGGNHTFNAITGNCNGNRNAGTSVEPGSGVTIMAYAGICGANNLAGNSIPYFHATSYDEIYNYATQGNGNTCPVTNGTSNNPPSVTANAVYNIPKSTPFSLTGSATDPDGDVLTYSWEETDPGPGSGGNWNSGNKPFFRTYAPVTTPTRMFPLAGVVQSGNYTGTMGEYLPTSAQTLNFRLTARDNKMGGGGVCYATTQVIVDSAGPFTVLYPSATNIGWYVNSPQTILWDPASTDQAPVSCDSVRILISYNSGVTYTTLVGSAPNFGFYTIATPNLSTTVNTCRIRIEAKGNVFYDIGNNNFQISLDPYVGLQEISRNNLVSLSVWPNPSSGKITFAAAGLDSHSETFVKITDLMGREILQMTYSNHAFLKEQVDLSTLEKGMYFISLENQGRFSSYRFLKE